MKKIGTLVALLAIAITANNSFAGTAQLAAEGAARLARVTDQVMGVAKLSGRGPEIIRAFAPQIKDAEIPGILADSTKLKALIEAKIPKDFGAQTAGQFSESQIAALEFRLGVAQKIGDKARLNKWSATRTAQELDKYLIGAFVMKPDGSTFEYPRALEVAKTNYGPTPEQAKEVAQALDTLYQEINKRVAKGDILAQDGYKLRTRDQLAVRILERAGIKFDIKSVMGVEFMTKCVMEFSAAAVNKAIQVTDKGFIEAVIALENRTMSKEELVKSAFMAYVAEFQNGSSASAEENLAAACTVASRSHGCGNLADKLTAITDATVCAGVSAVQ